MKRRETEISAWSEIFHNEKYKQLESLNGIIPENKEALKNLLSIRIPIYENNFPKQSIEQYNIETEKYITNMTTHNGLDFHIWQHNKLTNKKQIYSPYSNPWYDVYAHLLCAHYEIFKKRPILNFPNTDKEWWNEQIREHGVALMNEMTNSYFNIYGYLYHHEFFQQDKTWIHRMMPPLENNEERTEDGFGITWDEAILQFTNYFCNTSINNRFFIDKDLINLFLQWFIDVNRKTSWPIGNLNLKKISDVLYTILESPQRREDSDESNYKMRYEELK
ncbi:MAG: hypothetical protein ACD_80C00089G0004 [uncultured bacterium (gcode 4)]|uniref:Uncharacterized protein n=1 Tax=uncultured bacterium (gcode 4) TaxID=1234023 RepID=K1XJC1_9BACT|nr:MAG: hypothetical protein ACD_80C00089G0004 [uncultured bacterium (gcode 4)]